jgi:hypothetical protein
MGASTGVASTEGVTALPASLLPAIFQSSLKNAGQPQRAIVSVAAKGTRSQRINIRIFSRDPQRGPSASRSWPYRLTPSAREPERRWEIGLKL